MSEERAIFGGLLKVALPAAPSAAPELPLPATVLTTPVAVITLRILWLLLSATYRCALSEVSASPLGWLKVALPAAPSAEPAVPTPASVVATPVATMILRIL